MIGKIERTWDNHIVFYLGDCTDTFIMSDQITEEQLLEYVDHLKEQLALAKEYSSKRLREIRDGKDN